MSDRDTFLGERSEYEAGSLERSTIPENPIELVRKWVDEAVASGVVEPTAMCLATSTLSGTPSSRIVLLRKADAQGIGFFTNFGSRKGRELGENPRASAVLFWPTMQRQIRIEGSVIQSEDKESDDYWNGRPYLSQVASAASRQSEVMDNSEDLLREMRRIEGVYRDQVPRPETWGGYRILPEAIEFWQGRRSRQHDRFLCRKENGVWIVDRLYP